jgi:hypothetical protein
LNHGDIAIVAANIAGFDRLLAEDRDIALTIWQDLDRAFDFHVKLHRGERLALVVPASCLAEFPGALEALACAVDLQRDFSVRIKSKTAWSGVQLHIGVTDVEKRSLDAAVPGGVCVSRRVFDSAEARFDHSGRWTGNASQAALSYGKADRLWKEATGQGDSVVKIGAAALGKRPFRSAFFGDPDSGGRKVTTEAFREGDVYIDYPYEDAKFRWEKKTGKVYRRFYDEQEIEIDHTSKLFNEAISGGFQITREEYFQD